MSTKKYVCVLAGAVVVITAVVFGILGCEQNTAHKPGVKPASGPHTKGSPTPAPNYAGRHTEGATSPTPSNR